MSELENVSAVKPSATPAVLNIEGLELRVQSDAGVQSVVRNLSLAVQRGETFALVGSPAAAKA